MATDTEVKSAWKIVPQFHSRDIAATVGFYTTVLGFTIGGVHPSAPSPPTFCSVYAGDRAAANIYFFLRGGGTGGTEEEQEPFRPSAAMIALGTQELDQFYARLAALGAAVDVVEGPEDKEWGYRQFAIRDPDGNRLTFFKFLEGGNPGS